MYILLFRYSVSFHSSPYSNPVIRDTHRVGTNSVIDYWNGPLDWTTGLSYFPFLGKFSAFIFLVATYLATMDGCQ